MSTVIVMSGEQPRQTPLEPSLNEVLEALGWKHQKAEDGSGRKPYAHHVFDADGIYRGTFAAHEIWGLLWRDGYITVRLNPQDDCPTCRAAITLLRSIRTKKAAPAMQDGA
jgi:hypothetical protein